MIRSRAIWAVLTFLCVVGITGSTFGFAWYIQSDLYRQRVERRLSNFFGMPVEISQIKPHSFYARQMQGVEVYLPDRRARYFQCPQVTWDAGGANGIELTIDQAKLFIDSTSWQLDDYMRVLRASLSQNLRKKRISVVRFQRSSIRWMLDGFQLDAPNLSGQLELDAEGKGHAALTGRELNDVVTSEPIQVFAEVNPRQSNFLPEVTLRVPEIPLKDLRLGALLASEVTQGTFAGRVIVRQIDGFKELELSGSVDDVRLEEFTARSPNGPITGSADVTIKHAVVSQGVLKHLDFKGRLQDLEPTAIAGHFGGPALGGRCTLNVHETVIENNQIAHALISGRWRDGALGPATAAWCDGKRVDGVVQAHLQSLTIEDNVPVSGQLTIHARPSDGEKAYVDRDLLLDLFENKAGRRLPTLVKRLLPQRIEYTHMGTQAVLRDGRELKLLSVDGPAGNSMLTLRLRTGEWPLPGTSSFTLDIQDQLTKVRDKLTEFAQAIEAELQSD